MDKTLKDQDILLVREKGSNELKVANTSTGGKVNTAGVNDENPDFLRIDKNGNAFENFYENFKRQMKNPTHFEFFKIPAEQFQEVVQKLQEAFKEPDKPENKSFIDMHRIEPEAFSKKQQQTQSPQLSSTTNAINENKVDWSQFERIGISRETLEKTGNLEKLLNYQKTDLLPIAIKFDDYTIRTDARIGMREMPDGRLAPSIHAIRKEIELERPYFNVHLSEQDKQNLQKTGNLGRIAEAEFKPGEKTPVFLSVDKQTNELVAVRANRVKIPETIKGVELNEGQKKELSQGKAVWIEGMTSQNGKEFSAYLQFNADKRGFEFRFDNNKQDKNQKLDNKPADVPKTFRKKELSEDQRDSLREGKTVYVDGLEDKKGKKYSGYITMNNEIGKTDFMFPKDYKEALAAGRVTPDDRHKTQVEVNSNGKTNEATKKADKPLDKGQSQPTEKQVEKQTEKQEEGKKKKSTGVKM